MVNKFGRFDVAQCKCLRSGTPFRLYHSQSESFVNASCDAEKDRRYPGVRVRMGGREVEGL